MSYNLDNQKQVCRSLLDGLANIIEVAKGKEGEQESDSEVLAVKVYYHVCTILYLLNGTKIPSLKLSFIDIASLPVITRSALETFLVFNYMFITPSNETIKELRYFAWKLSGLLSKLTIAPLSDWGKEILARGKNETIRIREVIKQNQHFQSLTTRQQTAILYKPDNWRIPIQDTTNNWITPSWTHLATDVGYASSFATEIYKYFSQYAHAGSWSTDQIYAVRSNDQKIRMVEMKLSVITVLLASMIRMYASFNEEAFYFLEDNKRLSELVELYYSISTVEKSNYKKFGIDINRHLKNTFNK